MLTGFLRVKEDEEVAILRAITKPEMLAFYNKYISPTSATRAKLTIHLIAETSTSKNTSATGKPPFTLEQQKQTLISALTQTVTSEFGMKSEPEVFAARFKNVDVAKVESIIEAVRVYLKEDEGLEDKKIETFVAKGKKVLENLLPQIVGGGGEGEEGVITDSIVVEDVVAWKGGLALSRAARPVRALAEFEEGVGAKL